MPVLPVPVSVVMAELAGDVEEGLLAMAVGTGLHVMAAMMNADVEAVCGPSKHAPPARWCGTAARTGRSPSVGGWCR